MVGARVRKEVTYARGQIAATGAVLGMPDAYALVVFVSPPERIGHQSIAWLIADALRHSEQRGGLDGALIIETPLGFPHGEFKGRDTFSSLQSISGREFPNGLAARIAAAWVETTFQPARETEYDDFIGLGATE